MNGKSDDSTFRVAAFQGPTRAKDPAWAMARTVEALTWADEHDVHVLAMPETYLQGYFEEFQPAYDNSIDLQSSEFADICSQVSSFNATLLLGLNEKRGDEVYNTVVVIEKGKLIGSYSKCFVCYDYFSRGDQFPVFERAGVKYGIVICRDSSSVEPSRILSMRGAQVIFTPHFNRLRYDDVGLHYRSMRKRHVARAIENCCWIVRSNVLSPSDGERLGVGGAYVVDEKGDFVCQAEMNEEIIVYYAIPKDRLEAKKLDWSFCPEATRQTLIDEYQKLPPMKKE